MAVLIGSGSAAAVEYIPWRRVRPAVLVVAVGCLVWWHLPQYRTWDDLAVTRAVALGRSPAQLQATRAIRRTTSRDSVFLASYGAGLMIVGPAGRKTVAVQPEFSNPYVEYSERARDRDQMFQLLKRGDLLAFRRIAVHYAVTHVIAVGADECQALRDGGWQGGQGVLVPTLDVEGVCLFEVR